MTPVAEQVYEHLAKPGHVAQDPRRDAVGHEIGKVELLFGRLGGQEVQGVLEATAQIKGLVFELESAGFNF